MSKEKKYIQNIRRDYLKSGLLESNILQNPIDQFSLWFNDAINGQVVDGNAMALSTISNNRAVSRIVLLKSFDENGFIFFTNYSSNKARELGDNNSASLLFYWAELERQVRIEGFITKISLKESEEYFHERPRESQIGAWASRQSEVLESREILEQNFVRYEKEFAEKSVPLPPFWGGYILKPDLFEFWQGRPNRLHDRIVFKNINFKWEMQRLYP